MCYGITGRYQYSFKDLSKFQISGGLSTRFRISGRILDIWHTPDSVYWLDIWQPFCQIRTRYLKIPKSSARYLAHRISGTTLI